VAYDNGKTRRKIDDNSSGMMTAVVVVKRFTLQSVVSKLAHNAFTSSTPSHHILRQSLPTQFIHLVRTGKSVAKSFLKKKARRVQPSRKIQRSGLEQMQQPPQIL